MLVQHFPFLVDTDGDGQPDTLAQTMAQYDKYRPLFSAALRKALGPHAIMIANSGLGQVDPSLNGLTIEACNDAAQCVASFKAQAAVAHKPLLSVMWLKGSDPAECANAAALRKQLPFLLEGTDFYDGTHVVCSNASLKMDQHAAAAHGSWKSDDEAAAAIRPSISPAASATRVFVAGEEGYNSFRIPGIARGNCSTGDGDGEVLMLCLG